MRSTSPQPTPGPLRWMGVTLLCALGLIGSGWMPTGVEGSEGVALPGPSAFHVSGGAEPAPAPAAVMGLLSAPSTGSNLTVGRLRYTGGGDWYANPSSLPNLLAAIRDRTGIPVADREVVVGPLDPSIRDLPFLHMTGHGNVVFSPEERRALRSYLEGGGFLHADDNYGMDESFRREMALVFPDRELVELPLEHPVFNVVYPFPEGIPKIHEHDGRPPQAFGVFHGGRLMVLYSYETDLGNGWEDPEVHGNPPEVREAALRMGVNLFVYALSQLSP